MFQKVIFSILFSFIILGCSNPLINGPSKVVKEKAVEILKRHRCTDNFIDGHIECSNITITRAKKLPLSDANRANGLEELWCVNFKFMFKTGLAGYWLDSQEPIRIWKQNGVVDGVYDTDCSVNNI